MLRCPCKIAIPLAPLSPSHPHIHSAILCCPHSLAAFLRIVRVPFFVRCPNLVRHPSAPFFSRDFPPQSPLRPPYMRRISPTREQQKISPSNPQKIFFLRGDGEFCFGNGGGEGKPGKQWKKYRKHAKHLSFLGIFVILADMGSLKISLFPVTKQKIRLSLLLCRASSRWMSEPCVCGFRELLLAIFVLGSRRRIVDDSCRFLAKNEKLAVIWKISFSRGSLRTVSFCLPRFRLFSFAALGVGRIMGS